METVSGRGRIGPGRSFGRGCYGATDHAAKSNDHLDPEAIASLLRRANTLMGNGDVATARLVLRRAADAGDASAALTLTFDPASLAKLGVHGISPAMALARSWYEKAQKFGSAEASQRLEMLAS